MAASFFAFLDRMKYIDRWSLMRNTTRDDLSSHSFEVASVAYALCCIGNRRLGRSYDAERACALGLYHDVPEILTGDLPTPVKYFSPHIKRAYDEVETEAGRRLLEALPEDLRPDFEPFFFRRDEDEALWRIVKAADKLSALIKCVSERKAGNGEFATAEASIRAAIDALDCPEARVFIEEFLPAYEMTLDQL